MASDRAQYDETLVGCPVYSQDGRELGKVKEVRGRYFKVDARMQPDYWLTTDTIGSASGGEVRLAVESGRLDEYKATNVDEYETTTGRAETAGTAGASTETSGSATGTTERVTDEGQRRVQLREEELRTQKQPVEAGEVGVRKEVVSEQRTMDVPVTREEVEIHRRPVEPRPADRPIGEDEEIRVPVREEQVRVEKEPVVREEIEIGKRQVQDTERVTGEVRREEARIERQGDVDVRGRDAERR